MRKDFDALAKTLSNFAVLACMVVILMLAAVAMQAMRPEAHSFSLWTLWSPFLFLALPTMLLTGSIALLFETIPFLPGGAGNVAYFFTLDDRPDTRRDRSRRSKRIAVDLP